MRKKVIVSVILICVVLLSGIVLIGLRYSPVLLQLLFNKNIELKQTDQRINVLILGIGGGTHEGPNLSDTVIFASIDPKNKRATLVSIPRDLWVPDLMAKINTAYAFGEEKQKDGGLTLVKAVVSKILGQPIDYVVRIDFSGFVKAVDLVGGVDITVERTFDDYEYPIEGKENDTCGHSEEELPLLATASSQLEAFPCRYMHIHFDKGLNHMDGATALRYVRSRHALGPEGSDFARSQRQERLISAFKDKVFSLYTLLNPVKVLSLYSTLNANIHTDIAESEFDDFIKLAQKMQDATIHSAVLDTGDERTKRNGLLINPVVSEEYRYQWVLTPRAGNGNFEEIQEYISCEIEKQNCPITPSPIE